MVAKAKGVIRAAVNLCKTWGNTELRWMGESSWKLVGRFGRGADRLTLCQLDVPVVIASRAKQISGKPVRKSEQVRKIELVKVTC